MVHLQVYNITTINCINTLQNRYVFSLYFPVNNIYVLSFSFQHESSDAQALLNVHSLGHVLHAFVNGVLVGKLRVILYIISSIIWIFDVYFIYYTVVGNKQLIRFSCSLGSAHGNHNNKSFTLQSNVSLSNGINNVSLLSAMVGLPVHSISNPQNFHLSLKYICRISNLLYQNRCVFSIKV